MFSQHRLNLRPIDSQKIALALEYDGSAYHGWQIQKDPDVATIQGCLEQALSFVANREIRVHCAGRTDAGVHATRQIVHFESSVRRSEKAWVMGTNTHLPRNVAVKWVKGVPGEFHARHSATARRYRYVIYNSPLRTALGHRQMTWFKDELDAELMHQEAQCLLGERDFSAFRGAACQSSGPFRNVHYVKVMRSPPLVVIEIQANAFLLHMVRNIAGVLMAVGSGHKPKGWIQQVLASRDRTQAGVTAQPHGLYLIDVSYPDEFALPREAAEPFSWPSLSSSGPSLQT